MYYCYGCPYCNLYYMRYYPLYPYEGRQFNCANVAQEKEDKLYEMFDDYAKSHKKAFVCFKSGKTTFDDCYIVNGTVGDKNKYSVLLTKIVAGQEVTDLFPIEDIKNILSTC